MTESLSSPLRVGLVGYGAIGRVVADALASSSGIELVGAVVRSARASQVGRPTLPLFTSVESLLDRSPRLVLECAGHAALHAHGPSMLEAGVDLLVASVGALADAALLERLQRAAGQGGARISIPAGALAGLDALAAARPAGLDEVEYIGRKAPKAWRGTPAEERLDLDRVGAPIVFYEGTAREAALAFPQNANVVAAVALAGVGFERTHVRLMVDPGEPRNCHVVRARGAFGELETRVVAHTLPANPKTSMLAPWSLVRAVRNRVETLVV
ncbi:MAG TPA: aspartate dehydrogenase [Zeimonas sp.]|nr:aspartate dehydrogenase [Zeimonas sp.]